MPTSAKALIAWSSGKDSAWTLYQARVAGDFEIVGALTTITDTFRRVSMHGVREELLRAQLDAAGLRPIIIHIPYPVFPLWGRPTRELADDMIDAGTEAYVCTVDLKKLPASFAGRRFDRVLLEALPAGIDPCGENGEFHSFVSAGPMLSRKVAVKTGQTVERDGFAYTDLLPA